MRKLISSTFLSVDGLMAGPNNEMDWFMDTFTPEMGVEFSRAQATQDTFLLGETTYNIFAKYWPFQPDSNLGAKHINHCKKYVVSRNLKEAPWGDLEPATIINGDLEGEVKKIKALAGGDIVVPGSGSIVQQLTNLGLIDEYQIILEPVVLGGGKPLFENINQRLDLKLVRSVPFKNNAIALYYQPVTKGEENG